MRARSGVGSSSAELHADGFLELEDGGPVGGEVLVVLLVDGDELALREQELDQRGGSLLILDLDEIAGATRAIEQPRLHAFDAVASRLEAREPLLHLDRDLGGRALALDL